MNKENRYCVIYQVKIQVYDFVYQRRKTLLKVYAMCDKNYLQLYTHKTIILNSRRYDYYTIA